MIDESHYCRRMSKVWPSAFGDKWYILDDGHHTLEVDINFAEIAVKSGLHCVVQYRKFTYCTKWE